MTKQGLKHGFTLIETLVVVCVIGVLASLVIPRLTQQSKKAKLAEVVNMIGVISRAQNIHRQTKEFALGICPSLQEGMNWVCLKPELWLQLGLQDPNTVLVGNYDPHWRYSTAKEVYKTVDADWVFADSHPHREHSPALAFSGKFWWCGNVQDVGDLPPGNPGLTENVQDCINYIAANYDY